MNAIVIYKTKYGSTKSYAQWIGEELGCRVVDVKEITIDELDRYDTIIYGGGLYAEAINGVSLITKNIDRLKNKKIAIFPQGTRAKTVHIELIVTPPPFSARLQSSSGLSPIELAITSRKRPVPAEHLSFMIKSLTIPSSILIIFVS